MSKIIETIQITVELWDKEFAQLAAFLVSEENRAGATRYNGGAQEERFTKLVECHRGPDRLVVLLECLVEFETDKKVYEGGKQVRHSTPLVCLERLMRAIDLFPAAAG